MTACLMAYNGWSYVSFVAGRSVQPAAQPAALAGLGMTGVAALYIFANVAYLHVMTIPEIAATDARGRRPGHPHHGLDRGARSSPSRFCFPSPAP